MGARAVSGKRKAYDKAEFPNDWTEPSPRLPRTAWPVPVHEVQSTDLRGHPRCLAHWGVFGYPKARARSAKTTLTFSRNTSVWRWGRSRPLGRANLSRSTAGTIVMGSCLQPHRIEQVFPPQKRGSEVSTAGSQQ